DGSINEVDLLVFTPQGFFLIEIKSRPGRVRGDAGTWTWETEGKPTATVDNPLFLANSKAKKLRSLLSRQKACKSKGQVPWIDALVFCSAGDLQLDLQGNAAHCVRLRDSESRPGIMGAIKRRECPGLRERSREKYDRPTGKIVARAMEQAGIRPSQRSRKVSDYTLDHLINEGPGYQDWQATHSTLTNVRRRVRIYNVRTGATDDERKTIERAARREAELLETLQHPGILRREGFTEHELGPALIFEHDPLAIRLDHFLAQRNDQLSLDQRLDLMRQTAEVIRFAHEKRVVHRALSPQSVLVNVGPDERLHVKVFNWQVGYRESSTSTGMSRSITATSHVDRLVEDISTAYMAPEAITSESDAGEHLDVFSLGAIAYHLFSGQQPASNGLELSNKLRETKGLQISSVLNGATESLQELIQWSTLPEVSERSGLIGTVDDFLELLEKVEDEATEPDDDRSIGDPNVARKDDVLPGGYRVIRKQGTGSCSTVLLVEQGDEQFVLKAANAPEHNGRLKEEAAVLEKLRHSHIVQQCGTLELGDHFGFLMRPVFSNKEERRIETLRDRIRREGRLHIDLLQRFGEDLLDVVRYLEEEAGIPHRDLKPDNIAIGQIKRGDKLHLVLFDFSLSRAPADSLRAGTTGYLDPLLPLRKNKRWDLHAERYAAAATLYELAAGPENLPKWGDGVTSPVHLTCEATVDGELFDTSLRDAFVEFFQRAFRREPAERFDNAEQMLTAWRDCFANIEQPGLLSEHEDDDELRQLLDAATFDTQIAELGLGTRATNALDRANILSVEDLLTVPMRRLQRLRGVGNKTRREISAAVRILRERLGKPTRTDVPIVEEDAEQPEAQADVTNLSVDLIAQRITKTSSREGDTAKATLLALLGLDERLDDSWPSQTEIAPLVGVTRGRIGQLVGKFQSRWAKDAGLNSLRSDVAELLTKAGGVMALTELAEGILIARGSVQ
ncbi:MAG: BREX system serine/threonine kinase PglW, partial [Planctomycetota bacterium]